MNANLQKAADIIKNIRDAKYRTPEGHIDWEMVEQKRKEIVYLTHETWEDDESIYNEILGESHKVFSNESVQNCDNCNGDGVLMGWEIGEGSPDWVEKCSRCNGTGKIEITEIDCSKCDATGKGAYRGSLWGDYYPCDKCSGNSNIRDIVAYNGPETEEVRRWRSRGYLSEVLSARAMKHFQHPDEYVKYCYICDKETVHMDTHDDDYDYCLEHDYSDEKGSTTDRYSNTGRW